MVSYGEYLLEEIDTALMRAAVNLAHKLLSRSLTFSVIKTAVVKIARNERDQFIKTICKPHSPHVDDGLVMAEGVAAVVFLRVINIHYRQVEDEGLKRDCREVIHFDI